ncbi:MAG: CDP-alcohol phosphatidyltransferase family protein [Promethearchaeota archaeon]
MHTYFPRDIDKKINQFFNPASELFHEKLKLSPNQVSIMGYIIGMVSVIFILSEEWPIALILLASSLFFDGIDGHMARTYELMSETGEKLELIFDRSVEACMFLALAYIHEIDLTLALLTIYSILLMTSLRDKAKFDPGAKRVAIFIGFVFVFEIVVTLVFLIHIVAFVLQLVILNYTQQIELSASSQV